MARLRAGCNNAGVSLSPFRAESKFRRGFTPVLPDHCVSCFAETPGNSVTIWTSSTNWLGLLIPIAFFFAKTTKLTFPACRGCAWRIRFRRMASFAVMIALGCAGIYFSRNWVPGWPSILRRFVMVGTAIGAIIPWVIWEAVDPQAVTMTLDEGTLTLEFRNIEFSANLRMMNLADLRE